MKSHISHSIQETQNIAREWLEQICVSIRSGGSVGASATIAGLSGHLGSGKTAFTQAIARELGIIETVTSPTFVIMKKYLINKSNVPFKTLVHIDAYRLEKGVDLDALNFKEVANDPANLIIIEWPDKIADGLPAGISRIDFEHISEYERKITFS
jgi:tRNA threonylcarbamoyladenosine biosynthesis protein TsaE